MLFSLVFIIGFSLIRDHSLLQTSPEFIRIVLPCLVHR